MATLKFFVCAVFICLTVSCGSGGTGGGTETETVLPSNDGDEFSSQLLGLWTVDDRVYLKLTQPLQAELWATSNTQSCFNYLLSTFTFVGGNQYRDDAGTLVTFLVSVDGNYLDFTTPDSAFTMSKVVGSTVPDIAVCNNASRSLTTRTSAADLFKSISD